MRKLAAPTQLPRGNYSFTSTLDIESSASAINCPTYEENRLACPANKCV